LPYSSLASAACSEEHTATTSFDLLATYHTVHDV
jgi:hypothetical protein